MEGPRQEAHRRQIFWGLGNGVVWLLLSEGFAQVGPVTLEATAVQGTIPLVLTVFLELFPTKGL